MKTIKILVIIIINITLFIVLIKGLNTYLKQDNLPLNGDIDGVNYTWGHIVNTNSLNFREKEFTSPTPPNTFRIMVLGDSLTWGPGLSLNERYTAITEKILSQTFPNITIEVLNFGECGAPTKLEYDYTKEYINYVNPNLLVIGFCYNDPIIRGQEHSQEKDEIEKTGSGKIIMSLATFLSKLGLENNARKVKETFIGFHMKRGNIPCFMTVLPRSYDTKSANWKTFVHSLKGIKTISDRHELPPPILAILNTGYMDYNDTQDEHQNTILKCQDQAETTASEIGFTTYNHIPEIQTKIKKNLIKNATEFAVAPYEGHPSALMNQLYGKKLANTIIKHYSKHILALSNTTPSAPISTSPN